MPRFILVLAVVLFAGCASPRVDRPDRTDVLQAGDTPVRVLVYESSLPGPTLFNMHDDENTSVEAAVRVVDELGGRLVALAHTGERNLTFEVAGEAFTIDPNRMFTDAGATRSLERFESNTPAAHRAIRAFANQVLDQYDLTAGGVVVTLHNNTDQRYSALSYTEGADYEAEAAGVHIGPGTDPDDFYFVTDRELFDAFQTLGYNAVLQDNEAATDDGSLSVLAAQLNLPYVNVEAQHGHRRQQTEMIRALYRVLGTGV
ncbi:MAG: hypothetical protein AAGI08_13305 [Bacteroidota bacterium]